MDYKKIVDNNEGGFLAICGKVDETAAAFRSCKKGGFVLRGKFDLLPTDAVGGLNIRRSNLTDGAAVERVFRPFTSPVRKPLNRVFFDKGRDAVVATDGVKMLFCRIPEGLQADEHFITEGYCNWTLPISGCQRDTTPYELSYLNKVVEFDKCGRRHNILATAAACARAYRHEDDKGFWHNLYMWVGQKMYDPDVVNTVVSALFRLGCDKVGFYEVALGSHDRHPLHIVGFGNGLDARGLAMPVRFPSTYTGAVEFPVKDTAVGVAA